MRVEITEGPHQLKPGDYGQWRGTWYARPPVEADLIANLVRHEVHEHPGGTISVRPSIWVEAGAVGEWHGFLWAGQWQLNPPAEGMSTWPSGVALPSAPADPVTDVVEQIAQQWDGCKYDAPGEAIDIGEAIRAAGVRLAIGVPVDHHQVTPEHPPMPGGKK